MSRITFENYGRLAQEMEDTTVIGGRYEVQRCAERLIVMDVIKKLNIRPDDRLLEIGCGPGNLLIPLSFMVQSAVGIDHPNVCKFLNTRLSNHNVRTIGCNFLDYEPSTNEVFDKVLMYSVVSSLSDYEEAVEFIDKAVGLVAAGGRFLLGDIANIDRKNDFCGARLEEYFEEEWQKKMACTPRSPWQREYPTDGTLFQPNDYFVVSMMNRYRTRRFDTYVLAQPLDLPFGRTREDLLVVRPPE